ncbi:MMPL family transporter, partial [Nocardia terpenica]
MAVMTLCGLFGADVASHLCSGGFVASDMESARADRFLADKFAGGAPNYAVLVGSDAGADSPAARAAGAHIVDVLQRNRVVSGVRAYWTSRPDLAAALRSRDGDSALVLATVSGSDSEVIDTAGELTEQLRGSSDVDIQVGGWAGTWNDIHRQAIRDLIISDAVAVPVTALLLLLIFGSVVAAALPILIGLFSIAVTVGVLRACTMIADVSIFALNLTTALSLALAIDYSLFIVGRYREERARGLDSRAAVQRSVQIAGRTVLYSAAAVAISLSAMSVFRQPFLRSLAYAGVAVVAATAAAALLILPVCLLVLGDSIDALEVKTVLRPTLRRTDRKPTADTAWYRGAMAVMRHAGPVAATTALLLLISGSPLLAARFG